MPRPVTHIRRARRTDCATLTRIAHGAKRHWGYPDAFIRLWKSDLTVTAEFLAHNPTYCALRSSRIVGFYALSGTGAKRELEHMWVSPRQIRSGVGTALWADLVGRLRAEGVTRLRVVSDPNAEGFYRAMGARRIGRVAGKPAGRFLPLLAIRLAADDVRRGSRRRRRTRRQSRA